MSGITAILQGFQVVNYALVSSPTRKLKLHGHVAQKPDQQHGVQPVSIHATGTMLSQILSMQFGDKLLLEHDAEDLPLLDVALIDVYAESDNPKQGWSAPPGFQQDPFCTKAYLRGQITELTLHK